MRRMFLLLVGSCLLAAASAQEPDAEYVRALEAGRAIYRQTRNSYRAVAWLRRALRAQPDGVEAWRGIGIVEAIAERDEEALFNLAEAARLVPEDGLAWFWLGVVHRRQNRQLAAYAAFERATRLPLATGNEALRKDAVAAVEALVQADPGIAARARAAEEKPGPAALVLVAYLGASPRDAGMRDLASATMRQASSVEVGEALVERFLRVGAWDAAGFPAGISPRRSVSAGLSAGPPLVAGKASSRQETISVQDGDAGARGSASIAVLGPAASLTVVASSPDVAPEQRVHLEARIADAAGNLLYYPLTRWTAAPEADRFLARSESEVLRENDFEPHRNLFALPTVDTLPPEYVVSCEEPGMGLRGSVKLHPLARAPEGAGAAHGAAPWEKGLERALEVAAREGRLVLADFSADW